MKINDIIEDFKVVNELGEEKTLSSYVDKYLVLYFYPKDLTGGCTKEAVNYKEYYERLRSMGVEVLGISKDSAKSHIKFIEKHELPFHLITDEELKLIQYFDLWQEKTLYGRKYMGTMRETFIVDKNLKVIYHNPKVKVSEDAKVTLDFINSLAG